MKLNEMDSVAALVIIMKPSPGGKQFLCLRRTKDGAIGLPGGWREEGETPRETAIRECEEETGRCIRLHDNKGYVGQDSNGKIVTTYIGSVIGMGNRTHADEGEICWLYPTELLVGKFADYNGRALSYFGIY